jgi:hypothetical protein
LRSGFSGWQACERSPEVNDVSEELVRNIAGLNQVGLPLIEWVTHQFRRDAFLLMARLLAE